jgi:hypothetical protein
MRAATELLNTRAVRRSIAPAIDRAESAIRANSAPARPTGAITLRHSRHGSDVWPPTAHSLTASCTHTASDVFVILKAGQWVPRQRAQRLETRQSAKSRCE